MGSPFDEWDQCPVHGCDGTLRIPTPVHCTCSTQEPLCEACLSLVLTCDTCGWTVEDPEPSSPSTTMIRVGDMVTLMGQHDHFERMVVDISLDAIAIAATAGGSTELHWFNRYTGKCSTSSCELHPNHLEEKLMQPTKHLEAPPMPDHQRPTVELIAEEVSSIRQMLMDKNRKYGDSAVHPVRVFSQASPLEQINIRMDDKLSRITSGQSDDDEDPELDLIGYLILKRVARRAHGGDT